MKIEISGCHECTMAILNRRGYKCWLVEKMDKYSEPAIPYTGSDILETPTWCPLKTESLTLCFTPPSYSN